MTLPGPDKKSHKLVRRIGIMVTLVLSALLIATALGVSSTPIGDVITTSPSPLPLTPSVSADTPVATMRNLVFSDEFSGNRIDPTKWNTGRFTATTTGDAPFNPPIENAYYASEQVTVADGAAYLTIKRAPRVIEGETYEYASGMIQSENHFLIHPGTYIETRAKVESCDGCWAAFWALPSGRWPPELDFFEFFLNEHRPAYNFHFSDRNVTGPTSYGHPGESYLDKYHDYGMYWDGFEITPYLDGVPFPSKSVREPTPMYLIFNLTVYSGHQPAVGSQMAIDWVRVWR